ncbi:ralf-like 19 [Euphorbia peplus]|nr:ralf-like 19 [Euphorbia peplus]
MKLLKFWLLFLVVAIALVANHSTAFDGANHTGGGLVADNINSDEEMMMDSESSRRILAFKAKKYISYAALKADQVPCNKKGRSYYNCGHIKTKANPYRRACTAITKCQRFTH